MQITIAPALLSEAGDLARIQKAAFKPLYERFHDDANPYLRAEQLTECLEVIHQSFSTVAAEFGLTRENCPRHTSFILLSNLENQHSRGWQMFALYAGKRIIGYMSLPNEGGEYELHNLSVLPEYRHRGFGKRLLDYAKSNVAARSGRIIKIGIIEESAILKSWYIANGFVPTGAKKFEHLPFTSGYLEWTPSQG